MTMNELAEPDDAFDNRSLPEKRRRAELWVSRYTATAIGIVLAVTWVPGAATAALCAMEATMCFQIGRIYKGDGWNLADARAAAGIIGLAALVGPIAAMEAAVLLGPLAFLAKPAIAAAIVRAMGQLVIKHFEDLENGGGLS